MNTTIDGTTLTSPHTAKAVVHILVAERSALLREALVVALEEIEDIDVVASTSDPDETIDSVARSHPDVAFIGTSANGQEACDLARRIREQSESCQVIILDDQEDESTLVAGIEAGISAYLTWEAPLSQLLLVTRAVREGEVVVPRHMLRDLLDHLVTKRDAHDAAVKQLSALTRREREVLGLLAEGFDNEGIAGELIISPQTARTHIQNILQKLNVNSRLKAAAFVVQNGLVEELREERQGAA